MQVQTTKNAEIGHVGYEVTGSVVSATASALRDACKDFDADVSVITFDLGGVSDFDQPGFGAIIALLRRARRPGRAVMVRTRDLLRSEMVRAGLPRLVELV
jgi:anti-anti-sigma regulatory factor